jgi:hypothetical protein
MQVVSKAPVVSGGEFGSATVVARPVIRVSFGQKEAPDHGGPAHHPAAKLN